MASFAGPVLLSLFVAACGHSEAELAIELPPAEAAQAAKPEQVVQRIDPAPEVTVATVLAGKSDTSKPRASATPPATSPVGSSRGAQTITPKHLEAELNRLEAELNH